MIDKDSLFYDSGIWRFSFTKTKVSAILENKGKRVLLSDKTFTRGKSLFAMVTENPFDDKKYRAYPLSGAEPLNLIYKNLVSLIVEGRNYEI